jgi:Tfp pilus assembly protein PilF
MLMRFTTISVAAALLVLTVSTSLSAQRPDSQLDPRSVELVRQARSAQGAGNLTGANDLLESALAVDPRNREAFVLLADIARAQSLPGKAIRFYGEALKLDPNDVTALRGQGEAMVAKGAMTRAKDNLAKIKTLCKTACADATTLAATIAKGPPPTPTPVAANEAPAKETAKP